jgi:hypothetical protein
MDRAPGFFVTIEALSSRAFTDAMSRKRYNPRNEQAEK